MNTRGDEDDLNKHRRGSRRTDTWGGEEDGQSERTHGGGGRTERTHWREGWSDREAERTGEEDGRNELTWGEEEDR